MECMDDDDFTISIDLSGLRSNTHYYYQFQIAQTSIVSPIGETKTLPKGAEVSQVKLAVCSCSNYPTGLFSLYGAMTVSAADVIIHLGDYIYKYGAGQYTLTTS